jgi:hypothetical protein
MYHPKWEIYMTHNDCSLCEELTVAAVDHAEKTDATTAESSYSAVDNPSVVTHNSKVVRR